MLGSGDREGGRAGEGQDEVGVEGTYVPGIATV